MGTNYKRLLTMDNAGKSPREVLTQPVTVLLGVGQAATAALQKLNIETVFDLAASGTFRIAAAAAGAVLDGRARDGWFGQLDRLPRDAVDSNHAGILLTDAAEKPIEALRMISAGMAQELQAALAVTTVRDLGLWPPYHAARHILAEAYALPIEGDEPDSEAPGDLVPTTGRYPTERVQYQVVVLDQVLTLPEQKKARVSLPSVGPIDVTSTDVQGFSSPALGAVLTYTQSWFTEGLTLGQLLHTVALAPGESTRIAMIDWSRRTGARVSEAITETEYLDANLTRTRSISEVVDAVANESQSGFSAGGGIGGSTTTGSAGGGAVDLSSVIGFPLSLAGGVSRGLGIGASAAASYATSSGRRNIHAWMTQCITDSTHQNASSTRNRWATVVREVSQQESERVSTRALTNFNHMHALSVEYYEVVQLYRTVVELARADRCLFVPMRIIQFGGTDAALRFRPTIAAAGLIPEVRALAYADPDTLLFVAPNRKGPWSSATLSSIEGATGIKLSPTERALPLDVRLDLHGIILEGDNNLVVTDIFDTITIIESSGKRHDLPIQIRQPSDVDPLGQYRVFIQYNDVGSGHPPYVTDLRSVTVHKKSGKENWQGDIKVTFRGYWHVPGVATEHEILWLSFSVRVQQGVSEPVLGNFATTIGEADLVRHLDENALHYSQAIWRSLDGATLGHLLDHYTIDVGGTETPLAHVLDPIPLGAAGNYLMFRMPSDPAQDKTWAKFLEVKGLIVGSRREDLVPLPSGGVFAEAVLGRFNSAEKIDLKRFWNWQDSPIPITAPEIAAIQTGSRAQPEPVEPGQLGAPVVNIQNAPSLPDPQGLTAILQALASGAMFRDMSGLEGTQQLVRAFLEESMRGAITSAAQAGQNMQTAADFASRMAAQQGSSQGNRWGGSNTPNNTTAEGGRLNYGRELDERLQQRSDGVQSGGSDSGRLGGGTYQARVGDGLDGLRELAQYDAGIGGGGIQPVGGLGGVSGILKSNPLSRLDVTAVRDWYRRLAEHIERGFSGSVAAELLNYYLYGNGTELHMPRLAGLIEKQPETTGQLERGREVFLSKRAPDPKRPKVMGGVVPRILGQQGHPPWDGKSPFTMSYASAAEIPLSEAVYFQLTGKGDPIRMDLFHAIHGWTVKSDVQVTATPKPQAGRYDIHFDHWRVTLEDRYDFSAQKGLTVPNPDYGDPYNLGARAVDPGSKYVRVAHENAIRLERSGLAYPFDVRTGIWDASAKLTADATVTAK